MPVESNPMEGDSEDGSETSERTVLSDSEEDTAGEAIQHSLPSSGSKKDCTPAKSTTTHLANMWQFLLNRTLSEFRRFHIYDFASAETVTDIAEGASYRVTKSVLALGSQETVAIKHVKPQQIDPSSKSAQSGEDVLDTVFRELRILAHTPVRKNSNVAQLLGYGAEEIQGHLAIYLVAEFASGGTLKDYLTENIELTMLERTHFCYDIASGLAGLHACDIVQGDLKLANVLVFADEKGPVAKLSDFGCSLIEDGLAYTGTWIYNAPEMRRGRTDGFGSGVDMYASDVFSLGLVVWETMQGGRPFIDTTLEENHLLWLNGLPRDDLLWQALQMFESLSIQVDFPRRVMRGVLEGSLRDEPQLRMKCQSIVDLFQSDRIFSNSQRNTSSYSLERLQIPPLQKWAFSRTDNLAMTVPVQLQGELFTQLKENVGRTTESTIESAYFHLAMCHLTGFGTRVSQDNFLESLTRGAATGEAHSSGLYLRMHLALQSPVDTTVPVSHPIIQVEKDLRHLPTELYYSHRIRRHEKAFQKALLDTPFDLCSGTEILKRGAILNDEHTLDAIATLLCDCSNSKLPLLAVSDAFASEVFRHFLHVAARLGLRDIIEMMLKGGVDVNTREDSGATPLLAACRGGHADIVYLLMDYGADSWSRQEGDISAFHWLMMFEDDEVPLVLEKMRSTHNSRVMDAVVVEPLDLLAHGLRLKWSPVHFAVEVRNISVTKALLEAGASITAGDTTPLNIAVANHCPEMVRLLLAHGSTSWQQTPFLYLGEMNSLKLLLLHRDQRRRNLYETAREVLKSEYCDINQTDDEGYGALVKAIKVIPCDIDDMAVLDCLLDHKAQLHDDESTIVTCLKAREDGKAGIILDHLIRRKAISITLELLERAVMHGNHEILDSILATGIDVNARTKENLSPIMAAVVFAKNAYAVQALVDRGADVNAVVEIESERMSVLGFCLALPEGDGQMIDVLLNGGASVVMEDGSTIVFQACMLPAQVNGAHVLRHLLEKHQHLQALVNSKHEEYTPLHMASFVGNLEAVSILLEYGADVDITTGFNPITIMTHLARNPEERYVPFERDGFKLERWKLTAETVLMKLLDKSSPGHGRNLLHIATSICNYERVVELVERGLQPWRGDSEKLTPLGLLPKEVLEYDDQQNEDRQDHSPAKDFVVQGLKIKKYLEHQMILRTSQVKSLDMIDDSPVPVPPEQHSPFQLEVQYKESVDKTRESFGEDHPETMTAMTRLSEVYMMLERWTEAEELLRLVIQKKQRFANDEHVDYDEVHINMITTLIAMEKLEEAENLVKDSMTVAMLKSAGSDERPEATSHEANGASQATHEAASVSVDIGVPAPFQSIPLKEWDTAALDRCINRCCTAKNTNLAIALLGLSLIMVNMGRVTEANRLRVAASDTLREQKQGNQTLFIRIDGELICDYCALGDWQEAEKELQSCLYRLEFVAAEDFPLAYSVLLHVAKAFKSHCRWTNAEDIYQRLYGHSVRFRGRDSYYSTNTLRLLVNLCEVQLDYRKAGKFQSQLLETCKQTFGPSSTEAQFQKLELARIYEKENRLVECVILQRQALHIFKASKPENPENTLEAKRVLCKALTSQEILDEAETLAREVLAETITLHGDDSSATLAAMNDLALVLNSQDRCDEAIVLYKAILEKQEKTFGEMHESTRFAMAELLPTYIRANMHKEAEALGNRLVKVSQSLYGSESMVTLHVFFYLSCVYMKSGQLETCRDTRMQVMELEKKLRSPGHKETLYTMTELAQSHYALGEVDEAIALQVDALDGYRHLEGDNATKIMETTFALACSYHEVARLEDARSHYEEAITISRSILGDKDEKTITKLAPLMALYTEINEYDLAKNLAYETLWFMEEAHGDDHVSTQEARNNVIIVTTSLEKWWDAERQAKALLGSLERTHGVDHVDTIQAASKLADCLKEQRKYSAAEPLYDRVLKYSREHSQPEDEAMTDVMTSLVSTYRHLDKFAEAAVLNEEILDLHTSILGPDHDTTLYTTAIKAYILYAQSNYDEAAVLECHILSIRTATLGPADPQTLEARENLSKTYLKQHKYAEAAELAESVHGIREKSGMEDTDEDMLSTIMNLKDIYIAAKRWDDARRMIDSELIARQMGPKKYKKGDTAVIAALENLKLVAEGEGDAKEVKEVEKMVS
ncbi:MAG: hypothetical protein Q9169_004467 [Polycauliona sp. 2 TL-2023]